MKCLVVDDSATMRRIVLNALRSLGHTDAVEASDGADALAKIDESIELVITDWNMPGMSGLDLVRTLRAAPKTAALPVLMVTTRSLEQDILQAAAAGVNGYILRPFTPQVLQEKITQIVAAAQQLSMTDTDLRTRAPALDAATTLSREVRADRALARAAAPES